MIKVLGPKSKVRARPFVAKFNENVQLVTVELLSLLNIPPPNSAEFPLNVQSVTVGLLLRKLDRRDGRGAAMSGRIWPKNPT